jgi:hypothetical protein
MIRIPTLIAFLAVWVLCCTAQAAELTGSWKGQVHAADGSASDVQVDFSAQGFPLYSYVNNKGVARQVELTHVGQVVEYVPRGGGVQRIVVKSLDKGEDRLAIGIVGSFERAASGYLDQKEQAALFEYALTPNGLKMRLSTRTSSHFGDKDMIVGGDPRAAVVEGVLQRVDR